MAVSLALAFSGIAEGFSEAMGAPYYPATASWPGEAVWDDGGSIVTPGVPDERDCRAQIDACTEAMRGEAGYADKDVRLIVLAATLDGRLDTDASIAVVKGPNAGLWSLQTCELDPAGIGYVCRARRG